MGSGRILEDAVEVMSMERIFWHATSRQPLAISSARTNIAVSMCATGWSSILKVLVSQQYGLHMPLLHMGVINPNVDEDQSVWNISTEIGQNHSCTSLRGCTTMSRGGTIGFCLIWGQYWPKDTKGQEQIEEKKL